jgi:hypothetical protein
MGQTGHTRQDEPQRDREWEPMRLTSIGKVGDVVQKAIGKSPTVSGDTGESTLKPPGGVG